MGDIGRLTARGGLFYMDQKIAMDWHVDRSLREVSGNNPSQLDLFNSAGRKLTQEGIRATTTIGAIAAPATIPLDKNTAPYVSLDLTAGAFQLDGSMPLKSVKAEGSGRAGGAEFFFVN
ncbi:hypothetical protein AB5I41_02780 [Sphingomonas sp. MMS24-JH45]